ncbi:hypothetical protein BKA69DRAFT_1127902 [Paraphysoderma sedebokerense]|nr:hypothetical protein BKA69DRAFT_1127902 [Paraphysoderma sedebokerense]
MVLLGNLTERLTPNSSGVEFTSLDYRPSFPTIDIFAFCIYVRPNPTMEYRRNFLLLSPEFADILPVIAGFLSIEDLKNLSLTHSRFLYPSRIFLLNSISIAGDQLNDLKDRQFISLIKKITVHALPDAEQWGQKYEKLVSEVLPNIQHFVLRDLKRGVLFSESFLKGLRTLECYNIDVRYLIWLPAQLERLTLVRCGLLKLPNPLPLNLRHLDCADNRISSLPALPPSLVILNTSINNLNSLLDLPLSIQVLDLSDNAELSEVPALPNSLRHFKCKGTAITFHTSSPLPPNLQTLDCACCQLTTLPDLPDSLTTLNCSGNRLTTLTPVLPSSLQFFFCHSNSLRTLSESLLPKSLVHLDCSRNLLRVLPNLANSRLEYINCSRNNITHIPELPTTLKTLYCQNNRLSWLPQFPDKLEFLCYLPNNIDFPFTIPAGTKVISDDGMTV